MTNRSFYKFYQKTPAQRQQILAQNRSLSPDSLRTLIEEKGLSPSIANQMIENQIAIHGIPMGIVPELQVNHHSYLVPMATEEPSVIAAASHAGKIISQAGGFVTTQQTRFMIGEIAVIHAKKSVELLQEALVNNQERFLSIANSAYPSIVNRGGGAKRLWVEEKVNDSSNMRFIIFYLEVDTKEAMGANILNTMLEALRFPLETLSEGEVLMAILSNLATSCLVQATCQLPIDLLTTKTMSGLAIAEKITLASQLAQSDPYRATTHNKGIMNGIDAVSLATGNDWRAIEAGAHAYASLSGTYQPLATWHLSDTVLSGHIELPLPIATVGGSIAIHPTATLALELLERPTAIELASVIASIGLAQNFSALKALVTDGIQKGHMKLQAKSLALAVGATQEEIQPLLALLQQVPHLNQESVRQKLQELRHHIHD